MSNAAQVLPTYRLRAHNAATASENKIHDDDVARRHGFAGGLVPGITVFGYLTRPVVEAWGEEWLTRGTMAARFRRPIYEGDDVTVEGTLTEDGQAELRATNGEGEECAVGTASVRPGADELPSVAAYPSIPLPEQRVPPTPEALAALGDLGSVEAGFHAGRADETLDELRDVDQKIDALVGDDLALYRELGAAHPTWLLYFANTLLASNVTLGPWIHTGSEIQNFALLRDGQRLSARGRVAALSERKGHQVVDLDILMVADGAHPVMQVRHTAIYRLRDPEKFGHGE